MAKRLMNTKKQIISGIFPAFLILLFVSFILVFSSLAISIQEENQIHSMEDALSALALDLENTYFTEISQLTISFSNNTHITSVLTNTTTPDNNDILIALSTTKENELASIVYVMDVQGDVVSCSPYDGNKTITGNNYGFRPYFYKAINGTPMVYPALGVTTEERGIYFSSPVYSSNNTIIGVIVIKMPLDKIDALIESSERSVLLISPEGVIFSSNEPLLYHSIYQLSESTIQEIESSQQFGSHDIALLNWVITDEIITIDGEDHYYVSESIHIAGWQLLLYESTSVGYPLSFNQTVVFVSFGGILFVLCLLTSLLYLSNQRRKQAEKKLIKLNEHLSQEGVVLEEKVQDRTKILEQKLRELERWKDVTVNRELQMIKLKKELRTVKETQTPTDQTETHPKGTLTDRYYTKDSNEFYDG